MRTVNQIRALRNKYRVNVQEMPEMFGKDVIYLMGVYVEDVTNLLNRLDNPRPLAPHERISRLKKARRLNTRRPLGAAADRLMAHGSTAHGSRTEHVEWLKGKPSEPTIRRSDGSWPSEAEPYGSNAEPPTLFGS